MNRTAKHILLPAVMPFLFFAVASAPVDLLGCATRGLIAFGLSLVSGILAVIAVAIGATGRVRGDAAALWWVLSSVILAIPRSLG